VLGFVVLVEVFVEFIHFDGNVVILVPVVEIGISKISLVEIVFDIFVSLFF